MQDCFFDTASPEAQKIMDDGLTILARIIARDILKKRQVIARLKKSSKDGENNEHIQDKWFLFSGIS